MLSVLMGQIVTTANDEDVGKTRGTALILPQDFSVKAQDVMLIL